MDSELQTKIATLENKVDAIYLSVEKTRTYFKWTMIVSLVLFILPLLGLVFAIPSFLGSYTSSIQNLDLTQ